MSDTQRHGPPYLLGPRGRRLDYSAWEAACLARIGRVPRRNERLTIAELRAMGFRAAAKVFAAQEPRAA